MDTKIRPVYILSTRDPLQTQGHMQTESEGMEKDTPCKWKSKEIWSSNSHMRNNRLINTYAPNIGTPQYIGKC